MKTNSLSLVLFALLTYFAPTLGVEAVSPVPDGCYPNFTTVEGCDALGSLSTGAGNTGLGWRSLFLDTTGSFNTAVGGGVLALNNADSNTAVGAAALLLNTTGTENTAVGTDALVFNDTGGTNTANGAFALFSNTEGSFNVANGDSALFSNTTGRANIALGYNAGFNLTTGGNNIDIGNNGQAAESDTIRIGTAQTRTFIAGISAATVTGTPVVVNASGQLGVAPSSQRFKDEIRSMDSASEVLLALKPVTFRYKKELDATGILQFGLVAEEVEKVNPDLVARDEEGKPYTVRYEAVNAMLLNEFLKEHQTVQELKKQVAELTAGLQKVNAQLELSKVAPQTVLNNQ